VNFQRFNLTVRFLGKKTVISFQKLNSTVHADQHFKQKSEVDEIY
jgi:hypothetical protein